MKNLTTKQIMKNIEENIKDNINFLKLNIILEKLYFQILNIITLKLTKLPDEIYMSFKKEFDLLTLENQKSLELVKNIDILFKLVKRRKIYDILTIKYYNIIVNYCENNIKITEERAEKSIEYLKTINLYCRGISYSSNKDFSNTTENINKMDKHSKALKKLKKCIY